MDDKSPIERYWWDYAYLLILAGFVILLDQAGKLLVRYYLEVGETWIPWEIISDYAAIIHTWNTGATFGFLRGTNGFFIAISEIAIIFIMFLYPRFTHRRNVMVIGLGLGLMLGGAAGNLIDRIAIGYVTDIFLIYKFPVFNLADLCLLLGALILSLGLIFDSPKTD